MWSSSRWNGFLKTGMRIPTLFWKFWRLGCESPFFRSNPLLWEIFYPVFHLNLSWTRSLGPWFILWISWQSGFLVDSPWADFSKIPALDSWLNCCHDTYAFCLMPALVGSQPGPGKACYYSHLIHLLWECPVPIEPPITCSWPNSTKYFESSGNEVTRGRNLALENNKQSSN